MAETDEERAARIRASIRRKAGEPVPTPVPPAPEVVTPPYRAAAPTEHGLEAIAERGVQALTLNQIETLASVAHELETRQGIRDSLRRTAALGLVMVGILQDYLERKAGEGIDLGDLPIMRAMPSYLNSVQRALSALDALTPKGSAHDAEVKRVQGIVAGAGRAADDALEADDG